MLGPPIRLRPMAMKRTTQLHFPGSAEFPLLVRTHTPPSGPMKFPHERLRVAPPRLTANSANSPARRDSHGHLIVILVFFSTCRWPLSRRLNALPRDVYGVPNAH